MAEKQNQFVKSFPKGLTLSLSEHFTLKEYECSCSACTETLVSMAHVARLEKLRTLLGHPLKITSAYRCPAHNAAVGGVPNSQHTKGTATDLAITGVDAAVLAGIFPGVILYPTFTHLDSRNTGDVLLDKRGVK